MMTLIRLIFTLNIKDSPHWFKSAAGILLPGICRKKVAAIVKEWCETHRLELMDNWEKASQFEHLDRIQGADRD